MPAVQPPSDSKDVPVIDPAAFVVKKYTIEAISEDVENLLRGIFSLIKFNLFLFFLIQFYQLLF